MAPRARPQRQPNPPAPPPRDSNSPELGDPSKMQQYNALTGRPIRHSAGKVKRGAGYVDSTAIDFSDGGEEELSEEEVKQVNDSIVVSKRKRKRSPSPPSPSLEPIIRDEPPDELTDDELEAKLERCPPKPPITLQFNVPLGFHGPLTVKLNRSLLESNEERAAHNLQPKPRQDKSTSSPSPEESAALDRKVGFTDFPPELRNKVYRYLFLSDEPFKFPAAKNLCRSAQLLSSCKLVHSEGCSILYGENAFSFDRNRNSRGPFWEPVPQEIGYKDTLRFLQVIGSENLAYLREVKIVFEDANPASTPYLHTQEDRRYINDPYLLNCLRILREAKLRKLTLSFFGRRALMPCDGKFITYLERLKADEVEKPESPRWYSTHKIMYGMWERLHERITRKKKLYPENGK